jgi:hypothetical protein
MRDESGELRVGVEVVLLAFSIRATTCGPCHDNERGFSVTMYESNMTCKTLFLFTRNEISCDASSQVREQCGDKLALPGHPQ